MSRTAAAAGGERRLAARWVVLDAERHLAPGEIVWDAAGRITALRRPRGPVAPLGIVPGLVDAHVHLQIEPLAAAPRQFLPWVRAVMADRAARSPAALAAAARTALRRLLAEGVTAVGEIDSTGASAAPLASSGVAGRCYRELTGFHLGPAAARQLVAARWPARAGAVWPGLSPHAPYSVSAALFAAARARTPHLAIHCAEVPEEQQFLRRGAGPFAALLRQLGRLPDGFRPPRCGAVAWLERLGLLGPTTQLVHCQELERGDLPRLAAAGAPVVVCPGTIAWFGRAVPPVPAWLAAGVPVALGTDSMASNPAFSLRAELAQAARWWPGLPPRQLLGLATWAGGRALGRPGLGRLRRGGRADFVAVAATGDLDRDLAAFVHGAAPVVQVVCGGRRGPRLRR